jgi:hypothetical protein
VPLTLQVWLTPSGMMIGIIGRRFGQDVENTLAIVQAACRSGFQTVTSAVVQAFSQEKSFHCDDWVCDCAGLSQQAKCYQALSGKNSLKMLSIT